MTHFKNSLFVFVCKFIKFVHTIQRRFLQKIFVWPFLCIPRVILFNVTYCGHSTTKNSLKYQIWNFAFWVDKMSQKRAIFFFLNCPYRSGYIHDWGMGYSHRMRVSGRVLNASAHKFLLTLFTISWYTLLSDSYNYLSKPIVFFDRKFCSR